MDIYSKFAQYNQTSINGAVFAPPKGFVFSSTSTGVTVDIVTRTASGATESNRIRFSAGTHLVPIAVEGISMSTASTSTILLAY
jgi:hypothetical protein